MFELTVFISVKIANLKALSKFMPEIVNKDDKIKSENININTEMKYLFIWVISNLEPENSSLLAKTFNGLAWDASSFIENLKSE